MEIGRKKKKESVFKTAPDGRLIIKDDSDSDNEPKKRRPSRVPGLSDSGEFFNFYSNLVESKV